MSLSYKAMMFAREIHAGQERKYTGVPYSDHLAEVAGITACILQNEVAIATAWLHDCIEDQGVSAQFLLIEFGPQVASGVLWLSDYEVGNRAERKAASRMRLAQAPGWVQTIKCADLISNTASITKHDPEFAVLYLEEKRMLLEAMKEADPRLWDLAYRQSGGHATTTEKE